MKVAGAALLACLVASGAARGTEPLAEIEELLADGALLRASFVQERRMAALEAPLVSQGRLAFDAATGILWQIETPFPVTVVLRSDEILEWSGDGGLRRIDAAANPIYRTLAQVFLGALAGDAKELEQAFAVEAQVDAGRWRLVLTPKDETIRIAIAAIELSGSRYVETVRIEEVRGDETSLRFSDFANTPALDDAERGYLAE